MDDFVLQRTARARALMAEQDAAKLVTVADLEAAAEAALHTAGCLLLSCQTIAMARLQVGG